MRGARGIGLVLCLLLVLSTIAFGSPGSGPYLPFPLGKHRIARSTRHVCVHMKMCKTRLRHCNRLSRRRVACQSEVLSWERDRTGGIRSVVYCDWFTVAEPTHGSLRRVAVLWETGGGHCHSLHEGRRLHWPTKPN